MVQEIKTENLGDIEQILQRHVQHIGDAFTTLDDLMKWYNSGLSKGTLHILVEYSSKSEVVGLLVHSTKSNRTAMIFADQDFRVEKLLFDEMFNRYSVSSPFLIFESGYPTPWISSELSEYAKTLGFAKHDRQYLSMGKRDHLSPLELPSGFEFVSYTDLMIEEVTKLVFRSVDDTVDQDLFPFVYGTYDLTEKFHKQVVNGDFGSHKDSYSWVLKMGDEFVGSCFMILRNDDTGGIMHLSIAPEHRQKGLGRILLLHSLLHFLEVEPQISNIDLAVTNDNPARALYESLGFKKVNDSSTYVWKK